MGFTNPTCTNFGVQAGAWGWRQRLGLRLLRYRRRYLPPARQGDLPDPVRCRRLLPTVIRGLAAAWTLLKRRRPGPAARQRRPDAGAAAVVESKENGSPNMLVPMVVLLLLLLLLPVMAASVPKQTGKGGNWLPDALQLVINSVGSAGLTAGDSAGTAANGQEPRFIMLCLMLLLLLMLLMLVLTHEAN